MNVLDIYQPFIQVNETTLAPGEKAHLRFGLTRISEDIEGILSKLTYQLNLSEFIAGKTAPLKGSFGESERLKRETGESGENIYLELEIQAPQLIPMDQFLNLVVRFESMHHLVSKKVTFFPIQGKYVNTDQYTGFSVSST